jgi:hypothetical protein
MMLGTLRPSRHRSGCTRLARTICAHERQVVRAVESPPAHCAMAKSLRAINSAFVREPAS